MAEKRIRRSSYGGARPARDFPLLARAYLDGRLFLDELITRHLSPPRSMTASQPSNPARRSGAS